MSVAQKMCPKCKALMPLDAGFCGGCGHQFRTKFAPPVDTSQQVFSVVQRGINKPILVLASFVFLILGIAASLYIFTTVRHEQEERAIQDNGWRIYQDLKNSQPPEYKELERLKP